MLRNPDKSSPPDTRSEIGTIRKSWSSRVSIALVYPNRYHVGMSNLGFQTLYRLFNSYDHVVCERAFLPEGNRPQTGRLKTMESGRPIAAADIIAFSLSFENDYPHLLAILDKAGVPLRTDASKRKSSVNHCRRCGLFFKSGTHRSLY